MTVSLVRFTPSTHTNWHSHAIGQTFHVTEGLVGTGDSTVLRVRAGDTIKLAMFEAMPDGRGPTTWLEPIADSDYQKADAQ